MIPASAALSTTPPEIDHQDQELIQLNLPEERPQPEEFSKEADLLKEKDLQGGMRHKEIYCWEQIPRIIEILQDKKHGTVRLSFTEDPRLAAGPAERQRAEIRDFILELQKLPVKEMIVRAEAELNKRGLSHIMENY